MTMDPVSSADRIAALLRQRLLERARKNAESGASAPQSAAARVDSVCPATPAGPANDHQQRRMLIQTILLQEIGDLSPHESDFQLLVDRVLGAIESDQASSALLASALAGRPGVA